MIPTKCSLQNDSLEMPDEIQTFRWDRKVQGAETRSRYHFTDYYRPDATSDWVSRTCSNSKIRFSRRSEFSITENFHHRKYIPFSSCELMLLFFLIALTITGQAYSACYKGKMFPCCSIRYIAGSNRSHFFFHHLNPHIVGSSISQNLFIWI